MTETNSTDHDLTGIAEPIIRVTYLSLRTLLESEPIAFFELTSLAQDPQHTLFGRSAQILQTHGLLDTTGQLHDAVRQIVLASTKGEGLDLTLRAFADVIGPPAATHAAAPTTTAPMTDQQKRDLIAHCLHIAEIFDEELAGVALDPEAYRRGGVNGFYQRTTSGLYLEFSYGTPNKIWTPWGYWLFVGSTGYNSTDEQLRAQLASFMARLSVELHSPLQSGKFGEYGPVYKVLAVDGAQLPPPGDVLPNATLDEHHTAQAEWARLGGPHTPIPSR